MERAQGNEVQPLSIRSALHTLVNNQARDTQNMRPLRLPGGSSSIRSGWSRAYPPPPLAILEEQKTLSQSRTNSTVVKRARLAPNDGGIGPDGASNLERPGQLTLGGDVPSAPRSGQTFTRQVPIVESPQLLEAGSVLTPSAPEGVMLGNMIPGERVVVVIRVSTM